MKKYEGELPLINDGNNIATSIENLPNLKYDYVRAVHICYPENITHCMEIGGLDYSKYGVASSVAKASIDISKVEYGSQDKRFSSSNQFCLVFDMPSTEWNKHERITCKNTPTGLIPISTLVGIVPANQQL